MPKIDKSVLMYCEENKCFFMAVLKADRQFYFYGTQEKLNYLPTCWWSCTSATPITKEIRPDA